MNFRRALLIAGAVYGLAACQSTGPYPSEGVSPLFSFPVTSNETPYSQCLAGLDAKVDANNKPVFSVGEQADIKAESEAEYILNAQVTSAASAFGNLKQIGIETDRKDNGLVIADITQLSVANISADAKANDISLVNYTHLGKLDDPIVSATATAIGNAVNISVNSNQFTPPNTD